MEQKQYYPPKDVSIGIVAAVDAREQGGSMLVGAILVFGLAAGGLAIGYVTLIIQWLVTGFLGLIGIVLTISGVVKVLAGK